VTFPVFPGGGAALHTEHVLLLQIVAQLEHLPLDGEELLRALAVTDDQQAVVPAGTDADHVLDVEDAEQQLLGGPQLQTRGVEQPRSCDGVASSSLHLPCQGFEFSGFWLEGFSFVRRVRRTSLRISSIYALSSIARCCLIHFYDLRLCSGSLLSSSPHNWFPDVCTVQAEYTRSV
jgi:hypothetical protein